MKCECNLMNKIQSKQSNSVSLPPSLSLSLSLSVARSVSIQALHIESFITLRFICASIEISIAFLIGTFYVCYPFECLRVRYGPKGSLAFCQLLSASSSASSCTFYSILFVLRLFHFDLYLFNELLIALSSPSLSLPASFPLASFLGEHNLKAGKVTKRKFRVWFA